MKIATEKIVTKIHYQPMYGDGYVPTKKAYTHSRIGGYLLGRDPAVEEDWHTEDGSC